MNKLNSFSKKPQRVLFVDDEPNVLNGLQRLMFDFEDLLEMHFSDSGKDALTKFANEPFDVLVTDMRMPQMDGVQLLAEVRRQWPSTIRMVLSGQADSRSVIQAISATHQFLSKPCNPSQFKSTMMRVSGVCEILGSSETSCLLKSVTSVPCVPRVLDAVLEQLEADTPSLNHIADAIAQDPGICCKLLQIMQASIFSSLPRYSTPREIVLALGVERLRPLFFDTSIFSKETNLAGSERAIHQLSNHSTNVSQTAVRVMERLAPEDKSQLITASIAGLLHDIGQLIALEASSLSATSQLTFASGEVSSQSGENGIRDESHMASLLLSLWGISEEIALAVEHHRRPSQALKASSTADQTISAITAVHIANALEHALNENENWDDWIDAKHLEDMGLDCRIQAWHSCSTREAESYVSA